MTQTFTADAVVGDLRAHLRTLTSLQQASWVLRDVLIAAGWLDRELFTRLRTTVTRLVAAGHRKVDLVDALQLPRATIDSWTLQGAKPVNKLPPGVAVATPDHLSNAHHILPAQDLIASIDDSLAELSDPEQARLLSEVIEQARELMTTVRAMRQRNAIARINDGVRPVVLARDLGATGTTIGKWREIAKRG